MPTATRIPSNGSSPNTKVTNAKSSSTGKRRIARRRGRGPSGLGSDDDDIVREVGSDSDSDAASSLGSVSEDEDGSQRHEADAQRILTPSTTQSPPPREVDELKQGQTNPGPFKPATTDWSEMVAAEDDTGDGALPVIDFADFGNSSGPSQGQVDHIIPANGIAPASDDTATGVEDVQSGQGDAGSGSQPPRRPHGQNARLAYQQRLQDPAFIPRIGEFWGHDDRLYDQATRPLSNWWRGRGRGGFIGRGRGRGGFMGSGHFGPPHGQNGHDQAQEPMEVPPVDRAWTHDGFEEMKKRDDVKRKIQERKAQRGSFSSRGRGGLNHSGFTTHPAASGPSSSAKSGEAVAGPSGPAQVTAPSKPPGPLAPPLAPLPRVWYTMKPERTWTKQHEGFLFIEYGQKHRAGYGIMITIHLPGGASQTVRTPFTRPNNTTVAASTVYRPDFVMTVRLPPGPFVSVAPPTNNTPLPKDEHVQKVDNVPQATSIAEPNAPAPTDPSTNPAPPINVQLPKSSRTPAAEPEASVPIDVPSSADSFVVDHASIEVATNAGMPLQDAAASLAPSSSQPATNGAFSQPYGYPQLPPGVALNSHGMPYEVSSGRPVFIPGMQLPPMPPPAPYTPPAGMHPPPGIGAMPFVPGHMHHHSSMSAPTAPSPDFFAPHARPPLMPAWVDPAGRPIFTPARHTSRIEIRAPDGTLQSPAVATPPSKSSSLGLNVPLADATSPTAAGPSSGYHPLSAVELAAPQFGMNAPIPPPGQQPMYAPYPPPQFYYPEQHHYGYQHNPYMQMPPPPGYDYHQQPEHMPPPSGTVYYQ